MRMIPCVLAVCSLFVAAAAAQEPGRVGTQEPGRTEVPLEAPAHKTMVLTGCLAAGTEASTFRLNNAIPNAQATAVQPQAVATSGGRATYELKAEGRLDAQSVAPVDLKAHIGHQVEITARPDDTPAPAAIPTGPGAPTAQPNAAKPVVEKMERLTVTSIKQLAASCR